MFEFVLNNNDNPLCEKKIIELEGKYNITFPEILKEYYLKYDSQKISLCVFEIDDVTLEVAKIVPLNDENMSFEEIVDNDRADGFISNTMYPIARDRGGNYYYWDCNTENVYIYFGDDIENPFKVSDNISQFFKLLDNNYRK